MPEVPVSTQPPETAPAEPTAWPSDPARTYRIGLFSVTSFGIMTRQRQVVYGGTLEQIETAARSVLKHNLLAGWWGIPAGIIWTPIALARNAKVMRKLRRLAAVPPA
jgi:hypothetical protein